MKVENGAYYTVTATLTNSSETENACVSLFSEKRQIVAEDVTIEPNEKITFTFNVDIENVNNCLISCIAEVPTLSAPLLHLQKKNLIKLMRLI